MTTLDLPGATLDYEVQGAGPTVVQLHGLTSSRHREAELGLDLCRSVDHDHRVIRYDARGHGASTGSFTIDSYTWPRLADDLLALLDHVCPGEQVHGVGPSMGSATLLYAALRDPGRFRTLTLVIPPTAWGSRTGQRDTYRMKAHVVEEQGVPALVELGRRQPLPPAVPPDLPLASPSVPEHLLPAVFRGAALSDLPDRDRLSHLTIPTLILAWLHDPSHPVSTAALLDETLPNTDLRLARTPHDVATWPERFRENVVTQEQNSQAA